MRFLLTTDPDSSAEPTPESLAALAQLGEEGFREGWLIDTGGIQVSEGAQRVRYADGQFTVTDGPYAEAKEVIAGYAIVNVPDLDAALALSRRFYEVMGNGTGEVRQMFSQSDFAEGAEAP